MFHKHNWTTIPIIIGLVICLQAAMGLAKPTISPNACLDPTSIDLTQPTLFVVPYTHLDDIWRWNYPTAIKYFLVNTVDENAKSFQQYPHFKFNWTGAARHAQMKEYHPERYEQIKKWIADGRWFPVGNAWVEADVNVSGAESIIRQLLVGHQYFKAEFNVESTDFMLPDCFGFPYSLPSILSHCGLRGFSTQKLTWESANGIPFDVGKWIGPDGNWVIAALNCGNYAGEHPQNYANNEDMLQRLEANKEKSGLPIHYIYMGGGDRNNADRGGTLRKTSLETIERSYATDGPINVIVDRADLMFNAISDKQAAKLPTWEKDLLLIKHSTGVLTSQTYTKQLNHKSELLINATERAAVSAAYLTDVAYPSDQLKDAWKLMLRNQFHDILPGTSIPAAQAYTWNDGILALNQIAGIYADAIGSLALSLNTDKPGVPLVVYNPLSIERNDAVEAFIPDELTEAKAITAYDANGQAVPTQLTTGWDNKRRVLFLAKVPPVGAAVYSLREGDPPKVNNHLAVSKRSLENSRYVVNIDENGDIASVFDKQIQKELLEKPAQLEFGPDFPERKPAWRIYPEDIMKPARSVVANPQHIRVVEDGPVRVTIEVLRENEGSKILQRIRLYAGTDNNRVEVANHIDWRSRGALFKAAFHLTASNPNATYNLELGTIERGNRTKTQYEVPTHGWVDLTDESGSYGATILTECKYGSDKPDDNTLRLTLIHSPDTEAWEDETRDNGRTKEMRWQDWGRHEFNYAITGHKGDWREGQPHHEALRFEQRLAAFLVPKRNANTSSSLSLMQISNPQVNIQAVKMAEDGSGVVIRLQELLGRTSEKIRLSTKLPVNKAEELDGLERPIGEPVTVKNQSLVMDFMPYELKTILLRLPAPKAKPLTKPVQLEYDVDAFSYNSNREDGYWTRTLLKNRGDKTGGASGSLDGKGGTYPAEMIGDQVVMGNVAFTIGPREEFKTNAVACRGQSIDLPTGTRVLHLLAAADQETDVVLRTGDKDIPLTISGWSGNIGQWDNRVFEGEAAEISYSIRNDLLRIDPAYVRDGQRIAWFASHRHLPYEDTLYEYGYMFAYRLEIPIGAESLTLPDSPFVRILAMSVGDENPAVALQSPFEDLHRDDVFTARFANLNTSEVNDGNNGSKNQSIEARVESVSF
ncbi:alpha-mannosidase [Planctomycetota bacterium]